MPPTVGPGPTIVYNTKAQRANSIYFIIVPYCFVLLLEAQIARSQSNNRQNEEKVWLAKKNCHNIIIFGVKYFCGVF